MNDSSCAWIDQVNWPASGLIPAIAQDHRDGTVLMQAWMNKEALRTTVLENRGVYWSRSRQCLWRKGEESGHLQQLKDIRLDCDNDTILLSVEQVGGIACHTGRRHCFFKRLENQQWVEVESVVGSNNELAQEIDISNG